MAGEWVFTEALTSCRVEVVGASGAVVRSLACDRGFAAQGEAAVDWDGKDAAGALAPSGWYSMRLVAADGDGSAVDTDGLSAITPLPVFFSGRVMAAPSYSPVMPARLLDTRAGTGVVAAGLLRAGAPVSLQVAGRGGVPVTGVDSVVLNVTVTEPTGPGYITAWPAGVSAPWRRT